MPGSLLRERVPGHHARVTSLELFFDLVFVFAITQISHSLLAHLTLQGALETALLVMAIWWAWIYTAWSTNWLDPEHPTVRAMLFLLMGAGLVLSTSLSDAFDGRALPFALAYVAFQVGRTGFVVWACRSEPLLCRNFQRVVAWFGLSAALWIIGALAPEPARLPIWAGALGIEYLAAAVGFWTPGMGASHTIEWNVEGAHMAERCGLFVIICLGESILVTGATFAGLAWTPAVLGAFAAALAASIAMWWIYFSAHADLASHAIADSEDPGRIARLAYTYAHIPMVAGIIVTAAGDELVLAHPTSHTATSTAWVVAGGPALFLAGALWFKHAVFGVIAPPRATGLVLVLAAALASPRLTPLGLSAAMTAVLAFVGAWETWIRLRQPYPPVAAQTSARGPSLNGEGRLAEGERGGEVTLRR